MQCNWAPRAARYSLTLFHGGRVARRSLHLESASKPGIGPQHLGRAYAAVQLAPTALGTKIATGSGEGTFSPVPSFQQLASSSTAHEGPSYSTSFHPSSSSSSQPQLQTKPKPRTSTPAPTVTKAQKPEYTPAQIARTAASAIRLAAQSGGLADAFLILRSLNHTYRPSTPAEHARLKRRLPKEFTNPISAFPSTVSAALSQAKPPGEVQRLLTDVSMTPLAFASNVSPRLASHALLHSLLRLNEPHQAAALAHEMHVRGTPLRAASVEATLRLLQSHAEENAPSVLSPLFSLKTAHVLVRKPHMQEGAETTQAALKLLEAARRAGGKRAGRMIKYLVTLCIINGEIILASLVFGGLVREWQARQLAAEAGASLAGDAGRDTRAKDGKTAQLPLLRPGREPLREIAQFVRWSLAAPKTDSTSAAAFSAALQALANLTWAMDSGGWIAPGADEVLLAISKCPRTDEEVFLPGKEGWDAGRGRKVRAYEYLHDTMRTIVAGMDGRRGGGHALEKRGAPLTPWGYNTLLNYTLRHRHSIPDATIVLRRMLLHPDSRLPENAQAMYNILERSAADFPRGSVDRMMLAAGLEVAERTETDPRADMASIAALVQDGDTNIDTYALSTRITSLVRAGRGAAVLASLPTLLPGLYTPPTPSKTPYLDSLRMKARHREDGLPRAVALGPVVFTALLHALRKMGRTGTAETVFLYGLEAEARSFALPTVKGTQVAPWCLPVHAYTAMVQVYANERRKTRSAKPWAEGWGLTPDGTPLPRSTEDEPRVPRTQRAGEMMVFVYRAMMAAPVAIADRIALLRQEGYAVGPVATPVPDRWFFESMAEVFVETPRDPVFPALLRAMTMRGFAVPPQAQAVLAEVWGPDALGEERAEEVVGRDMRPVGMNGGARRGKTSVRLGYKKWPVSVD